MPELQNLTEIISRDRVGIVTQRLVDDLGSDQMGSTPSKRTETHDAFHDIVGFFI
jgi:hypothetical protein